MRIREPYRAYGSRLSALPRRPHDDGITLHSGRNLIHTATLSEPGSESIEVAVKAFRVPSRAKGLVYAHLRPSKARRSMAHAERLLALGIGTPDPVACIEYEHAGSLRESYYVCRYWPSDVDLTGLLYKGDATGQKTDLLLEELARFTLLQHDNGVLHLDYNPGNILVRSKGNGFDFALIDLNRLRFRTLDADDRISALVRLTTVVDYLRIIGRQYADVLGEDPERFCQKLEIAHSRFLGRRRTVKQIKSLFRI